METCVLGLSGGVDSAVAAALLQAQGIRVIGVYLDGGFSQSGEAEAREAARQIGIDFFSADIREPLERLVISPFCKAYCRGLTPNPCILCNPSVKFRALFAEADRIGTSSVATGHYARLLPLPEGETGLYASPSKNDQSYMLYRLPPSMLPRLRFPLGALSGKEEVRARAAALGFSFAAKADSMEICFIPDNDYPGFIAARLKGNTPPAGNFVDETGRVLGRHEGIHHYTVGQRRGLGVSAPGRLFVRSIRPETNEVVLSLEDDFRREITLSQVCWLSALHGKTEQFSCRARLRHSRRDWACRVFPLPDCRARAVFDPPARAPAPGQSAVFYGEDGRVLGGGFID